MGLLIKAIISGLFGGLFDWLNRRKAEQDRISKERDESVLTSQAEVKATEKAIEDVGKTARDNAGIDFSELK